MKIVLWILLAILGLLALLVLIACVRTLMTPARTSEWKPAEDLPREEEYAKKLSRMVQYETVSVPDDV